MGQSFVKPGLHSAKNVVGGEYYPLLRNIDSYLIGRVSREVNKLESVIAHIEGHLLGESNGWRSLAVILDQRKAVRVRLLKTLLELLYGGS